eukprot:6207663-Pleurochrysis_carterae.AAC.1
MPLYTYLLESRCPPFTLCYLASTGSLSAPRSPPHLPLASPPEAAGQRAAADGFRVLWVDKFLPEADRDSGSVRTLTLLKLLLAMRCHVTIVATYAAYSHYKQAVRAGARGRAALLVRAVRLQACPL